MKSTLSKTYRLTLVVEEAEIGQDKPALPPHLHPAYPAAVLLIQPA